LETDDLLADDNRAMATDQKIADRSVSTVLLIYFPPISDHAARKAACSNRAARAHRQIRRCPVAVNKAMPFS
jgi:hypothetical protein